MSIEQEVEYRKLQLVTFSKRDGPIVPVSRLRKIEVRDASVKDRIRVHFSGHDQISQPAPLEIRGNGITHTNFPRGTVKIERVAGENPITVLAHCERFVSRNGNQANE